MKIIGTTLRDCVIVEPTIFEDHRGVFFEGFNLNEFNEKTGIHLLVKQMNCSQSKKGVLRGLHLQTGEYAQSKLVFVTKGEALDVVVDIRKDSPTFGKHLTVRLSAENRKRIFVPKGFAHGFVSLQDGTELNYLVDEYYNKAHDSGISYADPELNIDWEIDPENVILSEKDKNLPTFRQLISE